MLIIKSYLRCKLIKLFRIILFGILCITFFFFYYRNIQTPPTGVFTAILPNPLNLLFRNSSSPSSPSSYKEISNLTDLLRSYLTGECSTPRPDGITKGMDGWEKVGKGKDWIFIYSAFFDDRPNAGTLPNIRLVTMATIFRKKVYEKVYCYIWYGGIKYPIVVAAIIEETGANLYNHEGLPHGEFTVSCPLQLCAYVPSHVSLSLDYCPSSLSSYTSVEYAARMQPSIDFGICVVNGYGSFKAEEMIEWFEAYFSFGVKEFNLYNTSYDSHLRPVFSYYERMFSKAKNRGVLSIRALPHPTSGFGTNRRIVRNLRTVALNDCLMRNMYRYKYILTVDHDEFITPRNSTNYHDMLQQISKEETPPKHPEFSFTIENLFFLKDFAKDDGVKAVVNKSIKHEKLSINDTNWKLLTEKYVHRCKPVEGVYYATKSFVNPLYCFNLFNHYCSIAFPPYQGITYHVPFRIAASHHYRKCEKFYGTNCTLLLKEKTFDASSLRFSAQLRRNVVNVYNKII